MAIIASTALLTVSCEKSDLSRSASATKADSDVTSPPAILQKMKQVADWQLANPSPSIDRSGEAGWTYGAFYVGVMALNQIADTPKYHDAMVAMGRKFDWKPAPRRYHADDQCVSQTYLDLYLLDKDPAMLQPTKEGMDYILANPSTNSIESLRRGPKEDRWWWCDALFMAPPVWARLSKATGDPRYLDFMDKEWWVTSNFLYDTNEHLFFRDSSYFDKQEANGKKIFWSRGNGWVLAGLARVMEVMPPDYPTRGKYEQLFKELAARIVALQQDDGLWRPGLLDPASYPHHESSGSGFHVYGLAWGINHGLLDRAQYEPAVRKAWRALLDCVTPEGKVEYVQPPGAGPKTFAPTDTDVYGAGALLLAGREMYLLAQSGTAGK